jgi:uncharacterized protein (DUF2252 family)
VKFLILGTIMKSFFIFCFCIGSIFANNTFSLLHNEPEDRYSSIVEHLKQQNSSFSPDILKLRYQGMAESPFTFYRATASLFYSDLGSSLLPVNQELLTNPKLLNWSSGDFHTQNIGFFDLNHEIIFGLNDYDESWLQSPLCDVIRFLTSIHLMTNELSFQPEESELLEMKEEFLQEYVQFLDSEKTTLASDDIESTIQKKIKKLQKKKSLEKLLDKWTEVIDGHRRFQKTNPKLEKISPKDNIDFALRWTTYTNQTAIHPSWLAIKDKAIRLNSGLGSLGVKKFYVLVEGQTISNDDDLILEVKEQLFPASARFQPKEIQQLYDRHASHAGRAFYGAKRLSHKIDPYTGTLTGRKISYLVRRISPFKDDFSPSDFDSKKEWKDFIQTSARVLASAHKHAGGIDGSYPEKVLAYLNSETAESELLKLSEDYFHTVVNDYELFLKALEQHSL